MFSRDAQASHVDTGAMSHRTMSSKSSLLGRTDSLLSSRLGSADTNSTVDYQFLQDDLLDEVAERRAPLRSPPPPPPFSIPRKVLPTQAPARLNRLETASEPRLVIAIDFGTTFTGVAYCLTTSTVADLSTIEIVIDWGPEMNSREKIPSVISYSPARNEERQFGADVCDDAVTMMNFKLELEVQDKRLDELELTLQVLEGTNNLSFEHIKKSGGDPEYSYKAPADIVTDYLTKVCESAWQVIEPIYLLSGQRPLVDIVVTVPVKWSYHATNATFRAIWAAGFNKETIPTLNDMILLTEPEAASYFTVRHLQDRQERGSTFLKPNDPFILCDAGGGTVDAIAYQVKQLDPYLELVQISMPTNDKCGAAYIDTYFKRWLRRTITPEWYHLIDPTYSGQRTGTHTSETPNMRKLIRLFDAQKKNFTDSSEAVKLDLPEPLHTLSIGDAVREGELTIQPADMKKMFDYCVSRVITLIQEQRQQVELKSRKRVKNVFLVGGFGESQYLQKELEKSLKRRDITLRRPEQMASWTAVVQGGVIAGIERNRQKHLRFMSMSPKSYGIVVDEPASYMTENADVYIHRLTNERMARQQFAWLVRKGDLILSDEMKMAEKEFTRTFTVSDSWKFDVPVYVYPDEEDDVPERWANGQNDVEQLGVVKCDITNVPEGSLQLRSNYETGERYTRAFLICRIRAALSNLEVEVLVTDGIMQLPGDAVKETKIGYTTIQLIEGASGRRNSSDSGVSDP